MKSANALKLFEGYGIEIEYMIVGAEGLDVAPISDELIRTVAGVGPGKHPNDAGMGKITLANELVCHVAELCNSEPAASIGPLAGEFQQAVNRVNSVLSRTGARLMPTAMHPWMDPAEEACFWPHEYSKVYNTYDRIFNCRRHGWANVQSSQLNVSFSGDEEFASLHAACRFLLPVLPALAASSPVVQGRVTGFMDTRLVHYKTNQAAVPSVSGLVIPEQVYSEGAYRKEILERMYCDIAPHDPEGVLRYEWLNSRGVIPRFDRSAMEIRVVDSQECPAVDMAISEVTADALKAICSGRWADPKTIAEWPSERLIRILEATIKSGEDAVIEDKAYLEALGYRSGSSPASRLWQHLADKVFAGTGTARALEVILARGTLAKRILKALEGNADRERLKKVYSLLCDCLAQGSFFIP